MIALVTEMEITGTSRTLAVTGCRGYYLDSKRPEYTFCSRRVNPWVGWEGPGTQGEGLTIA